MTDSVPTRSKLALKGSSRIVSDFFEYSIHSILYQRGIYPPEDFQTVRKYGLNMVVSTDDELQSYIKRIMKQLHRWIYGGSISRLVVAIVSKDSGETVEKWQFNLEINKESPETVEEAANKPNEQIQREIQAIIRQITASVTFLPELDDECTFNVLVYADQNCRVPEEWGDSRTQELTGEVENVKFRSFSTDNHRVDALVSYKFSR
ncbi:hypothetical protein OGAPHI_004936 [Ogataea philodendri]|uniref:HORMA domain-containing protein n=1 Tax=Ogataea philodendri TaxID=1378263 RepID=A0A9P8P1R1_9ASCO|nr:uncharacterized protein OGAPHI_004936 [Ogataea philodendri]KAH3663535.1 hypothetical protein OGAPHI_004936 [Ogataea philodendri]